ncbi:MAG: ABC transporter permease [Erysipelothrix sp.]|nr:ABC transporter permease [Erysipelothrix sp.]
MNWITILEFLLPGMMTVASPLMVAGIGGMFAERSGVVNIALEGLMLFGSFVAATIILYFESLGWFTMGPWMSLFVAGIAGALFSLILALSIITLRADHTIAGTAVNMLAAGLTVYLSQILFDQQRTVEFKQGIKKITLPGISEIPILGGFFTQFHPTVFLALAVVFISWFVMYKTPFGLRLRSCGENPQASASMGIDVLKTRYIAVIISGFLSGIAGGMVVLSSDIQFTSGTIHGLGFIAVAAIIFGKWKPFGILGASMFFGLTQSIGVYANRIPIIDLLPSQLFIAIPYIFTIVALIAFRGKSVGPKAAGEIYDVSKR